MNNNLHEKKFNIKYVYMKPDNQLLLNTTEDICRSNLLIIVIRGGLLTPPWSSLSLAVE